ncbi:hypothetical protein D3C80_1369850 [compost metagenome]
MVDAQAVDQAAADQLEEHVVGGLEHLAAFDPQTAQFVDVEKTPPVDVVGRGAPAGQAVRLAFQQTVQALETLGAAAVEGRQQMIDGVLDGQRRQLLLQTWRLVGGLHCAVQGDKAHAQGLNLGAVAQAKNLPVVGRADGKAVLMVLYMKAAPG